MIRLNGSWAVDARAASQAWNVPWFSRPGQVVRLGPDLDRAVDLGVLEGDRDLGGEQLDQLELVLRVAVLAAEPLERQDAGRRRRGRGAGRTIRLPSTARRGTG